MTDHIPQAGGPEFDLLAQLIAESSFGTLPPDTDDADPPDRIDDSPEQDILLRERIRHADSDAPPWTTPPLPGSWHTDTETTKVFDKVGQVFPEADGSIKLDLRRFNGRWLYALSGSRVMRLSAADARLPGGADRASWALFSVAERPCHSLLRYGSGQWELEAAIRWQVTEPETTLSLGLKELTPELVGEALAGPPRLILPRAGRDGIDDGGAQMLSLRLSLEKSLTDLLASRGIMSECAVRMRPWPTSAQREPYSSAAGMAGDVSTKSSSSSSSNWPEQRADMSPRRSNSDDSAQPPMAPSSDNILARRAIQDLRRALEFEHQTTTRRFGDQVSPGDLFRLMRRIHAGGNVDYAELPSRLARTIATDLQPNYPSTEYAFAILYECLRVNFGMDPVTAESEVEKVLVVFSRMEQQYDPAARPLNQLVDIVALLAEAAINLPSPGREPLPEPEHWESSLRATIMHLVDEGMSVEEVADEIGIDPVMVEQYLREAQDRRRDDRHQFLGVPF